MSKAKLAELIERVEKATGPDREIDCAIVKIVYGVNPYPVGMIYGDWEFYTDNLPVAPVPPYTASLDAIVALVERAGYHWHVSLKGYDEGKFQNGAGAWIDGPYSSGFGLDGKGFAATPPLALLLAFLRAQAERGKDSPPESPRCRRLEK